MKHYKSFLGIIFIFALIYFKSIYHFTIRDFINLFSKQTELVIRDYNGPLFLTLIDNQAAYIDTAGRIILKTRYDNRSGEFKCGRAKVYNQENKYGFIDKSGKLVIDFKYVKDGNFDFISGLSEFNDNHAIVFDGVESKLIDTLGNVKFSNRQGALIGNPCKGFVKVGSPVQSGIVDYQGNIVIPVKYRFIRPFSDGLFVVQQENGKYGCVDSQNNIVIDTTFEDIEQFYNGVAPAKLNGKWGLINKQGEFILKPTYDEITSYSEGLAKVFQNEKYGYIDTSGVLQVPVKYENVFNPFDKMHDFHNNLATVKIGDKWGFINRKGEFVIKPVYAVVHDFNQGIAWVKFDDSDSENFGFINVKGEVIYRNKK